MADTAAGRRSGASRAACGAKPPPGSACTSCCRSGTCGDASGSAQPCRRKPSPVGIQTIATAYRDYTRKSIQDAQSYVEKLSGARSLDKAMEVQTEFAKQAYETFAADSRKIRGLYGEFFTQTMRLPKSPFDRTR